MSPHESSVKQTRTLRQQIPCTILWLSFTAMVCLACGRPAPEPIVKVEPIDAQAFRELLQSGQGQPLLVNFWATWCEPCRQEFSILDELAREMGDQVRFVGVSVDNPDKVEQVEEFLTAQQVSFPQYIRAEEDDEVFINAIDPGWNGAVPSTFVYDDTGARARRLTGQQTRESLVAVIESLLPELTAEDKSSDY